VKRSSRVSDPLCADRRCRPHGAESVRPRPGRRLGGWSPERRERSSTSEHGRWVNRRVAGEVPGHTGRSRRRCRRALVTPPPTVPTATTATPARSGEISGGREGRRGGRDGSRAAGGRWAPEEGGCSERRILRGHAQPAEEGDLAGEGRSSVDARARARSSNSGGADRRRRRSGGRERSEGCSHGRGRHLVGKGGGGDHACPLLGCGSLSLGSHKGHDKIAEAPRARGLGRDQGGGEGGGGISGSTSEARTSGDESRGGASGRSSSVGGVGRACVQARQWRLLRLLRRRQRARGGGRRRTHGVLESRGRQVPVPRARRLALRRVAGAAVASPAGSIAARRRAAAAATEEKEAAE
jgi:hypothetical protein